MTYDFKFSDEMDKKVILRNFKDQMQISRFLQNVLFTSNYSYVIVEYGKPAEEVINQKIYQLLKSPRLDNGVLEKADEEVSEMLKTYQPRKNGND